MSRADGLTAASRRRPASWRWPVHPRPRPGEAFTSWLQHSARQNEVKLASFVDYSLGNKVLLTRDMDKGPNLAALARLARCCAQDEAALLGTTLRVLEGRLCRRVALTAQTRWVLPVTPGTVRRPVVGTPFCPECLAGGEPYFRLAWRFSFAPMCLIHGRVLHDACPFCQAPVVYQRLESGHLSRTRISMTSVSVCWRCQLNLGEATRRRSLGRAVQTRVLALQDRLLSLLDTNSVMLGERKVSALDYTTVVYQLMKLLSFGSHTALFRAAVSEASGVTVAQRPPPSRIRIIESLDSVGRVRTLALTEWVVQDWPLNLVDAARQARLSRSQFTRHLDPEGVPGWFREALLPLSTGHGRPRGRAGGERCTRLRP